MADAERNRKRKREDAENQMNVKGYMLSCINGLDMNHIHKLLKYLETNKLAWCPIFQKGQERRDRRKPPKPVMDDKRHQLVLQPTDRPLPLEDVSIYDVETLLAPIIAKVDSTLAGLFPKAFKKCVNDGPILKHVTILRSLPDGPIQQTHIDFEAYKYDTHIKDTMFVIIVSLQEDTTMNVEKDATEYYKLYKSVKGYKSKGGREVVDIPCKYMFIGRAELAHGGSAYMDINYRLHLVYYPDTWNDDIYYKNQTTFFSKYG